MMMISDVSLVDASAAVMPRVRDEVGQARRSAVLSVSPNMASSMGQNRLEGDTTGFITGANAHAAVRMHAFPVNGSWVYCPKTKTRHSQRSKVAT